ncbi:hypothetical protein O1L68_40130 [Streptomyces lydicus]|nr:hypothetical protein [Streptomyces lydicus]
MGAFVKISIASLVLVLLDQLPPRARRTGRRPGASCSELDSSRTAR